MRKTLGFLLLWGFFSPGVYSEPRSTSIVDLEDLLFYEKILLDFYAGEELQTRAIRELESRCRWKDTASGFSCANLAILYLNKKDLPRAYTAAALAYKKEPRSSYYRNLFQNMAIESDNIRDMQKRMGSEGKTVSRYTRAIQACNENLPGRALPDLKILVLEGNITKEQLNKGLFADCLEGHPDWKESLQVRAKSNPLNYSQLLIQEEDKTHPFRDIWDLSYARKEATQTLTDSDQPSANLTRIWMEFQSHHKTGRFTDAQNSLLEIQTSLKDLSTRGPKNKILADSLGLAIHLNLTQDSRWKHPYRFLP